MNLRGVNLPLPLRKWKDKVNVLLIIHGLYLENWVYLDETKCLQEVKSTRNGQKCGAHQRATILLNYQVCEEQYYMSKKSWPIFIVSYYIKLGKNSLTCCIIVLRVLSDDKNKLIYYSLFKKNILLDYWETLNWLTYAVLICALWLIFLYWWFCDLSRKTHKG